MIILIDGDDTIWLEEQKFKELKLKLLDIAKNKIDPYQVDQCLEKRITELGFGRSVFVQAILETSKQFDLLDDLNNKIGHELTELLEFKMIMIDGFIEFSVLAKENMHKLFIYTKGREEEQLRKVRALNLESLVSGVFVVAEKNTERLRRTLNSMGLFSRVGTAPGKDERVVMIGNCPKDDIWPAVENGIEAIYFNFQGNPRSKNILPGAGYIEVVAWSQVGNLLFG
jgi:FMN phosphatase YigB (HAD superfamily)